MNNIEGIDARPLITRRLAWDMLPHLFTPVVLQRLKMVPPGDEAGILEHEDSHHRLDPVLQIEPYLKPVLPIVNKIMCAAMLVNHDDHEPSPLTEEVIGEIVRASCVGVLAYLVDQEVVQVNEGAGDHR